MQESQLNQVKEEVQKILDKHLDSENRFSIQEFDEDSVFLLIDLLLEKDDLEREHIRAQLQENINKNDMNIELTNENILEIKDKLDSQKNEINDLNDLKELIHTDAELDSKLKEM